MVATACTSHCIEAAASPADASWININAIDDLSRDILTTDTHLTIAALQGNASAGGVFLALAADRVLARSGIVLNPHYRNMGNLYGSEYWTYLLPRRVGADRASAIMGRRLPLGTGEAANARADRCTRGPGVAEFRALVEAQAATLVHSERFTQALAEKRAVRERDEGARPLASYRAEELERMRLNFYGFDPSYHVARHRFVHRTPHAWTPLHLAQHRRLGLKCGAGRRPHELDSARISRTCRAGPNSAAMANCRPGAGCRLSAVRVSPRASLRTHRLGTQQRGGS